MPSVTKGFNYLLVFIHIFLCIYISLNLFSAVQESDKESKILQLLTVHIFAFIFIIYVVNYLFLKVLLLFSYTRSFSAGLQYLVLCRCIYFCYVHFTCALLSFSSKNKVFIYFFLNETQHMLWFCPHPQTHIFKTLFLKLLYEQNLVELKFVQIVSKNCFIYHVQEYKTGLLLYNLEKCLQRYTPVIRQDYTYQTPML